MVSANRGLNVWQKETSEKDTLNKLVMLQCAIVANMGRCDFAVAQMLMARSYIPHLSYHSVLGMVG